MSKLDRRSVLLGSLGGVALGGPTGFFSGSLSQQNAVSNAIGPIESGKKASYAQQGEDLVVEQLLWTMGASKPSYLDIGAHHPIINSNTYLFRLKGGHGVLVEPNPTYADLIRKERPEDIILEVGIGVTEQREADYYVLGGDGQRNTFSKEQVDELSRINGRDVVQQVIKRSLIPINDVMKRHFPNRAPDFVSMDIEGLDYAILKTLDFTQWRPKVFCIETCELDGTVNQPIVDLLKEQGYVIRGGSFVNFVFADEKALFRAIETSRDAGAADAGR